MRLFFTPLIAATLVMTTLVMTTLVMTTGATPSWAHQCILGGSTATDMQIYNSCKADLATGTAGHGGGHGGGDGGRDGNTSEEILRLKAENDALKARLTVIRQRLLAILGNL